MYDEINKELQLAKKGDVESKKWLLDKLKPLIIASIRRNYNRPMEYEDLMQEGKVIVLECINNFDETKGAYFLGYVKTMLSYYYLDKNKQKDVNSLNDKVGDDEEEELIDLLESDIDDPLETLVKLEENNMLYSALNSLTTRQREVIIDFYYEGLSISQISEKLGVSYRTVVNTKVKGLENMKRIISFNAK